MQISKLEAAKRQLNTSINLFFRSADPVSIHTLVAASHQVLMDLAQLEGVISVVKNTAFIKKGMEKKYLSIINEAENFFKHADRDSNVLLKFNPDQSEFLLLDAVEMYFQLAKEMPIDMSIFRVWFLVNHPELINEQTKSKFKAKKINLYDFQKKSREEFYMQLREIANGR